MNAFEWLLIVMREKHLLNNFLMYLLVEIQQYTWNKQFPSGALWKRCSEKLVKIHKYTQEAVICRCSVKSYSQKFCKFTEKHFCQILSFNKKADWMFETVRSSHRRCSVKKEYINHKNFANFAGKHLCWRLILIKLQFLGPITFFKRTQTQMLSCEICEFFKNNYFEKHVYKLILNFI